MQLIISAFTTRICRAYGLFHFGMTGMMMRSLFSVLMLGCIMAAGMAANAAESVRPFTQGSLARVLEARQGRPFILMLWSLECQYCPAELKMLSELKRSHPKMDVVLIATDTVSDVLQ